MKKKILVKILTVVMTASILLYGCGQQTESQEESVQSSQVVQEVDESTGQNSMFQGTIFDNLVMGETTVTDVEELLDGNITHKVFVRTKNGEYDISFMVNFTKWEFIIGLENVTHWMPIPKLQEVKD